MFPGKTAFTLPDMAWHAVKVKLPDSHRLLPSACFSSPERTDRHLGPRLLLFSGYWGSFGAKGLGREADHSPLSHVDVKNTKSYTFNPSPMPSWCGAHLSKGIILVCRYRVLVSSLPPCKHLSIENTSICSTLGFWMEETVFRETDTNTLNKQSQVGSEPTACRLGAGECYGTLYSLTNMLHRTWASTQLLDHKELTSWGNCI
jgi:hypothetical protein